jgi:hypothetical protein
MEVDMTRAEQEAFEKWKLNEFGDSFLFRLLGLQNEETHKRTFLAGYRAGFEAQHYDIEDLSKEKVE